MPSRVGRGKALRPEINPIAYLCSGSVSPAGVLQVVFEPVDAIAAKTTACLMTAIPTKATPIHQAMRDKAVLARASSRARSPASLIRETPQFAVEARY